MDDWVRKSGPVGGNVWPVFLPYTRRRQDILTDYGDVIGGLGAADAGGPLQLYAGIRLGLDLGSYVTDHVTADDRHVGRQAAQSQDRRAVDCSSQADIPCC